MRLLVQPEQQVARSRGSQVEQDTAALLHRRVQRIPGGAAHEPTLQGAEDAPIVGRVQCLDGAPGAEMRCSDSDQVLNIEFAMPHQGHARGHTARRVRRQIDGFLENVKSA